jgi:hypothetical protein
VGDLAQQYKEITKNELNLNISGVELEKDIPLANLFNATEKKNV